MRTGGCQASRKMTHKPVLCRSTTMRYPDPISDSAAWLRWLAARASTLYDRLDAPPCMIEIGADERLVQARAPGIGELCRAAG